MAVTEYQKQLCAMIPVFPPADVMEWSDREGLMDYDAIVYRAGWEYDPLTDMKLPAVECTCSACGRTFYADRWDKVGCCGRDAFGPLLNDKKIYSGKEAHCPKCGKKVAVYHCSDVSRDGRTIVWKLVMRFMLIDGNPAAVTWSREKYLDKQGRVWQKANPYEAYVFAGKKCYRFCGWYKYFFSYVQMDHWEECARCDDRLSEFDPGRIAPWDARMFDGTIFENAKLDLYLRDSDPKKTYPITYLRSFQQHPQVENLIVQGMTRLYNDLIYANKGDYYYTSHAKIPTKGICWKNKKPAALLGVTKEEFRRIKKEHWTLDELVLVQTAREHGAAFDILYYRKRKTPGYNRVKACLSYGQDPYKADRYVKNQKKKDGKASLTFLEDYWALCRKLEITLTPRIAYPQDLRREHDRVTALYNAQAMERKAQENSRYNGRFAALENKYAGFTWTHEGLTIGIAHTPKDLLIEGQTLGHCVGTYIQTHAGGKHCIFLLRRAEKPDEPYYTLELDMKTLQVLQNRGKKNCARTPEVKAFEEAWLAYIGSICDIKKGA